MTGTSISSAVNPLAHLNGKDQRGNRKGRPNQTNQDSIGTKINRSIGDHRPYDINPGLNEGRVKQNEQ
jgi:hypothetical protein